MGFVIRGENGTKFTSCTEGTVRKEITYDTQAEALIELVQLLASLREKLHIEPLIDD